MLTVQGANLAHDVLDALPDITVVLSVRRDERERPTDLVVTWLNAVARRELPHVEVDAVASMVDPWRRGLMARCLEVAASGRQDRGEAIAPNGIDHGFSWHLVRADEDVLVWVQRDLEGVLRHRAQLAAAEARLRTSLDQSFDGHAFFHRVEGDWVSAWTNAEYGRLDHSGALTADIEPLVARAHESGRRISELVPIAGQIFEVRLYPVEHEVAVSVADQTEIFSTTADLVWDVLHDPLTHIGNRAKLQQDLGTALSRNGAATLLCLDLDGFKGVNDTMGHAAGDEVLREVAQRISGALREGEEAYRLGGDEFVVVAGPLGQASARAIAARIADRIIEPISTKAGVASIAVSIGATVGTASEPTEGIIARADAALYEAKRNDLVVVFA